MLRPLRLHLVIAVGWLTGCDPVVVDHSPATNLLDPETCSLETSLGHWTNWYDTAISRDSSAAKVGSQGLRIAVTEPDWGVGTDNWPGFDATPGTHHVTFWARGPPGIPLSVDLELTWFTSNANQLQVDTVSSATLSEGWVKTTRDVSAPAGAERMSVALRGSQAAAGEVFDVDGVYVQ
jgi:hypothetical protein